MTYFRILTVHFNAVWAMCIWTVVAVISASSEWLTGSPAGALSAAVTGNIGRNCRRLLSAAYDIGWEGLET